ncbi:MAG: hypothetical protein QG635_1119, partial [Bacteroidota bacterium]|nr:hypothetical protein [Bacteroidota bacterium]
MILNLANDNLEGKIQFRGIRFGFNNLTLYDFKLFTAGDTLVSTPEITVRYKLLPLIDKKLIINNVEIKYPRVKLLRSLSDSTWNFQHIAKPNPDTTVSPPPNLTIDVDNLNISDASLTFRDSTMSGS